MAHGTCSHCQLYGGLLLLLTGLNLASIGVETDRRGFVPVSDKMEVLGKDGKVVPNVYCIGDANGKYMLAHAASAQVGAVWTRPSALD